MNFQEVLNQVQTAESGKTVLCHCNNWPEMIWVAFKRDEHGNPVCTIFLRKENSKFGIVNGARFAQFEIADIVSEWETTII